MIGLVKDLKASARGELEITDLNVLYMRGRRLTIERLGRGFAAVTHDSLMEAAEFVRVQHRHEQLVCAGRNRIWIGSEALKKLAAKLSKTQYSRRLQQRLLKKSKCLLMVAFSTKRNARSRQLKII